MEDRLIVSMLQCFFIAFGVILGGTLIGSIGSFMTGEAPLTAMYRIAKGLRIWAIVAAIGGTFDAISNFEKGIFDGSTFDIFKQVMIIIAAMGGVKTAFLLFQWLLGDEVT
ncbi:YtrH family sporulation protein [Halobacillus yeomjeoni]|uniref:YtrH family sporulation protein n=1 Tax=Halobacillus yeomjeoni TaxID=311194 RepID=A0A931HV73_9BACI|nr:YtrH family sporulation protein [Halobacillus yeomjeoni]MBH0230139.1 YtrH family sporulation protein [Halobacillus yeomjeoni]MCA0982492.1 YtrH family sporulation protein [Halobacillus yeomjeoni]